jgi:hypothetical protein
MAVFFNGRLIVSPATASVVNDAAMRNQNLSVGNVVALVGRSAAGAPKTALRFGSPQEAQRELVSGELLDADTPEEAVELAASRLGWRP